MKHLFLTVSVLATCLASATHAGVVEERKAKFKENVTILRAIQTQIGQGDFKAIAAGGRSIANWAIMMPDFFPEGSESAGALDAIWLDFDDFQSKAAANNKAALQLEQAASTKDAGQIMSAVQKLSGTCKSCHRSFKSN
jgi:cytochrome c556